MEQKEEILGGFAALRVVESLMLPGSPLKELG